MERKPKPWENPDDPKAGLSEYDMRPLWERSDPALGVSTWDAIYHFVDRPNAVRLFELDLMGYGDDSNIDPLWWPEELSEFQSNAFTWRRLLVDLRGRLFWKLARGDVIAKGFSNQMPLDAPRRPVNPERWKDLELDVKESLASGPGIEITQILIFPATAPATADAGKAPAFSGAALRQWYVDRIARFEAEGSSPSREDDVRDANAAFGRVPKRQVEALRRELAPERWTRKGRPSVQ